MFMRFLFPSVRRHGLAVLALLPFLLSLAPLGAAAQEAALNTRSYSPMPEGAAIWVEALDDSDFNLSIEELFARELDRSGQGGESAAARLNLTFDTLDRFEVTKADNLGEISVDTSSEASLRLSMWSSSRDSLFNRHDNASSRGRFMIVAILYDNETQRRLWEAEASAPADARNDKTRLANLVLRIVDQIGETARQDELSLN